MFKSMDDYNLMATCMDASLTSTTTTTTSSSSSMHNISMLQNNIHSDTQGASCLFNVSSCLGEGDCSILEVPCLMGMENDYTNLGNRVMDGYVNANPTNYIVDKTSTNFNNYFNVDIDGNVKVEDVVGFENHWPGENLKMGEWNLEDLFANIPSLPFLDL